MAFKKGLSIVLLLATLAPMSAQTPDRVLNGIDVLREQNFAPLAGKRIGLITNHTGLAADGVLEGVFGQPFAFVTHPATGQPTVAAVGARAWGELRG